VTSELPIPPLPMREAVGPTDVAAFDNPSGRPVFAQLPGEAYDSVFDFGCGCGRLARQLIQQTPRPRSYLGVDLHLPLVEWAQANLAPQAPGFEFAHHDVRYEAWNPGADKPDLAPFPTADGSRSLVIAFSVFTHLVEAHAEYYLAEVARALAPGGFFYSTWFLFDKRCFPMMQDFQNALFINELNPANAVIFDRGWLVRTAAANGLAITAVEQPEVRGHQWYITMEPVAKGVEAVELPPDEAPISAEGRRAAPSDPRLDDSVRGSG
jgi:SAM-dependent methyltransferase